MDFISYEDRDDHRWIRLQGELDQSEILQLKKEFDEAVQGTDRAVVVDLGAVTYMGTLGVGLLVTTQKKLTAHGRQLKLANTPLPIERTFVTMALETFFERVEA
jgi:anti-sigma B factor antagonist